jgi:hypothetical protein
LNNIVEQVVRQSEHRFIKRIIRPMLGFKSFRSAQATLAGIELWRMLKKGQGKSFLPPWDQFYALASALGRIVDDIDLVYLPCAGNTTIKQMGRRDKLIQSINQCHYPASLIERAGADNQTEIGVAGITTQDFSYNRGSLTASRQYFLNQSFRMLGNLLQRCQLAVQGLRDWRVASNISKTLTGGFCFSKITIPQRLPCLIR